MFTLGLLVQNCSFSRMVLALNNPRTLICQQRTVTNHKQCSLISPKHIGTSVLIDQKNGMSTCLELFNAPKLGNHVHYTFIFTFFFLHTVLSNNNNHHVAPLAWISLTLSRHLSLWSIASGRSSRIQPVSAQSCCM